MTPIHALRMRNASSGSGGSGSQRQAMVIGSPDPTYVNTTSTADKQYALPSGAYLNEQS